MERAVGQGASSRRQGQAKTGGTGRWSTTQWLAWKGGCGVSGRAQAGGDRMGGLTRRSCAAAHLGHPWARPLIRPRWGLALTLVSVS